MKKDVQLKLQKLNNNHRYRMIWYRIVSVLAFITVFITAYALILPAVTMESASDEEIRAVLYSNGKLLRCPLETHHHTAECYDEKNNLICGYADYVVHKHDSKCFGADGELMCQLPEIELHSHDMTCENEQHEIVCEKNEVVLHKHSSECYDENGKLICGMLEVTEHIHSIDCFKMPAVELREEYDGLSIRINADEGVFPVVTSELTLKAAEAPEEIRTALENRYNSEIVYKAVEVSVLAGENIVCPSENLTITFKNTDANTDMKTTTVSRFDSSTDEEQLDFTEISEDTVSVSTRYLGTFVLASPIQNDREEKKLPLTASASDGVTYSERLTDRSNDIGVFSEGYTDSPYTFEKTYYFDANVWGSDLSSLQGGTIFIGKTHLTNRDVKVWQAEQYWDGKSPFRITSAEGANGTLDFQNYNDFLLEDEDGILGQIAPNAPIKFDNIYLEYCKINPSQLQNLYGRGNKFVIGENVTTENGKTWKLYGGTEHNRDLTHDGRPDIMTNVVVASGNWGFVFGGGEGATGCGTQVTIRGNANVENVYGGGERKGSIGINNENDHVNDHGVNVYIEGGNVGNLYGGSAVNGKGIFTGSYALTVNENININITGGHVNHVVGGDDTTDDNTMDNMTLENSPVNGNVIVNISAQNSVGSAAGDPNRNTPMIHSANLDDVRQVKGYTWLNVSASNDFTYFDDFDVVNITGSNVVVTSQAKPGYSFTDSNLTWWGSTSDARDGYIGQIRVAEGAKLVLDHGGVINRPYNHYVTKNGISSWQYAPEADRTIRGGFNKEWFSLSHSWVGEISEERRSLSTVAINGQGAGITAASSTVFDDTTDVCGLRINGTVQGSIGEFLLSSWDYNNDVPGYSTLEVTGTPLYSNAENYYYYIVADNSANGGKAFREPEGADYIVCYRNLDNGKIGWYLRERPEITMSNRLVRAGDTGNGQMSLHVDMNGLGYEWNSDPSKNTVDLHWTKTTGTDGNNLTSVNESILLSELANIESDTSGRFSNVVFETSGSVRYLKSFDYVIDQTTPVDPTYYELEVDFHVLRNDGGTTYEDVNKAVGVNAARCIYDFAGADNLHGNEGYSDAVMDTFPYSSLPAGQDTALLRMYLPYGVTGGLTVSENDNHFRFAENTSIDGQLIASTAVSSNYEAANNAVSNSQFAVTIGGSELSQGITKSLTQEITKYICTVYSHKNITIEDISQKTSSGLQLELELSDLRKGGDCVGSNDPSAVNNGELQIQTLPSAVSLVITKQIINAVSNSTFPFTVSLKDSDNNTIFLDQSSVIGDVSSNDVEIGADGTISFSLRHNQSIRLTDIPLGSTFTLTETQHNDYTVVMMENDLPIVTGDRLTDSRLDRTRRIVVFNCGEYELPETGKSGIYYYIIFGVVLMIIPIIIGFVLRHGMKRRAVKK